MPPWWEFDMNMFSWSGYCPIIIDELAKEMGFSYEIVPDELMIMPGDPRFSADDVFTRMNVTFAMLTTPSTHDLGISSTVVYTAPWYSSYLAGLVLKTEAEVGLWRMFEPFTPSLWFAIVGSIFIASFMMVVLAALVEGRSTLSVDGSAKAVYHAWAAMLGGEDYEWVNWPGRILRLSILFLVLLTGSTYTANLAAFFTKPRFVIHGPKDMASLRDAVACMTDPGMVSELSPYVQDFVIAPQVDVTVSDQRQFCHQQVSEKKADIWIDDYSAQNFYLLGNKHCSSLALSQSISLMPNRVGFALSVSNQDLATQMSQAIVWLEKQQVYKDLGQEMFRWGQACPLVESSDTAQVDIGSMGGLFVVCGALAGVSLLVGIAVAARQRSSWFKHGVDELDHSATEGEMLRALLRKVDGLQSYIENPGQAVVSQAASKRSITPTSSSLRKYAQEDENHTQTPTPGTVPPESMP
jgi:hypothetical protein